jgi:hypothetical protein
MYAKIAYFDNKAGLLYHDEVHGSLVGMSALLKQKSSSIKPRQRLGRPALLMKPTGRMPLTICDSPPEKSIK